MSFTCAKCGVALDLEPGAVPLLGEPEEAKRARWIYQAGKHMAAMHPEVIAEVTNLQGQVGFVVLLSHVKTDDDMLMYRIDRSRREIFSLMDTQSWLKGRLGHSLTNPVSEVQ